MKEELVTGWKQYEVQVIRHKISEANFLRIEKPAAAMELFSEDAERLTQESLWVMTMDGRNGLMGIERLYQGTATGTSVRISEIFRYAISVGGCGIVLVHNHPSGDPSASDEDIRLTEEVLRAARLLDVEFLDHLIVAGKDYTSIRSIKPAIWGVM